MNISFLWKKHGAGPREVLTAVPFMPKMTDIVRTDSKGALRVMRPTKEAISRIFTEVENDPLAGMGIYSKREIAADRIMQLLNTSDLPEGRPSGSAAPLFTEPATPPAPTTDA